MLFQRHGEEHAERKTNQRQGDKQLAFTGTVRERREEEHTRNGPDIRQDREHAYRPMLVCVSSLRMVGSQRV